MKTASCRITVSIARPVASTSNWVPSPNLTLDAGVGVTVALADLPDNDNNIFGWLGNSHLGSPLTRTVNGAGQNGWFGNQRDVAAMKAINNQRHRTAVSPASRRTGRRVRTSLIA